MFMIINFKIFENFKSGLFGAYVDSKYMTFNLDISQDEKTVNIMYDDNLYAELSITIPGSEELENGEFFLNPEINPKILKELVNQSFIEKTTKNAVAGDKTTTAYRLI